MKVVIISDSKSPDLYLLQKAFEEKGFEKAPFIKVSKVGMFTEGTSTEIVIGTIDFSRYDAVFLKAGPQFTQFVEPFLDELVEKGIYCNVKPESYYIMSNKPFQYAALNSRNIPTPKTVIIPSIKLVDQALEKISFPLFFKVFRGHRKIQNIVVDSERGLKSISKSIKTQIDAITLQEYLEGDLDYCIVVGKDVFTIRRKWDEKKLEHAEKGFSIVLADKEQKTALRAASVCGADIATVKMIKGKVSSVSPIIDIERFNRVLGNEIQHFIARHYWNILNR